MAIRPKTAIAAMLVGAWGVSAPAFATGACNGTFAEVRTMIVGSNVNSEEIDTRLKATFALRRACNLGHVDKANKAYDKILASFHIDGGVIPEIARAR